MRKILKNCDLATAYKNWHDELESSGERHPKYKSSHPYYWDVVMNLYACQKGLCAYTEILLCDPQYWEARNWKEGQYAAPNDDRPQVFGQLEHFDSELKTEKAWLWDNLFVVQSDINTRIKRTLPVDEILKPDAHGYDEFARLAYNGQMHVFFPNPSLPPAEQDRIHQMLYVLGINHGTIKSFRKNFVNRILKSIELGVDGWDQPIEMFPTAVEMLRRQALDDGHKSG